MHRWCKFGENVSNTLQDDCVLTVFRDAHVDGWTDAQTLLFFGLPALRWHCLCTCVLWYFGLGRLRLSILTCVMCMHESYVREIDVILGRCPKQQRVIFFVSLGYLF